MNALAGLLDDSPASGLNGLYQKLRGIAYALLVLLCLPYELVAHRRIGRRYHANFFFFVSMVVMVAAGGLAHGMLGIAAFSINQAKMGPTAALGASQSIGQSVPFFFFACAAVVAFFGHCWANRGRFGTADQLHSFDSGVPTLVFPPFASTLLALFGLNDAAWANEGAEDDNGGGMKETMAYPSDSFFRNMKLNIRHHIEGLRNGLCPYGVFAWMAISWLEPILLAATGIAIVLCLPFFSTFGFYLIVVAVALRLKASIHASTWLEWAYNECDQRLEVEAKRNWRDGKPANEISASLVVPVSRAVIPAAVSLEAGNGRTYPSDLSIAAPDWWSPPTISGEGIPES